MLQIGYLIICEDTTTGKNDELIINSPLAALTPISIPSNYTFRVAFSLHDSTKDHFTEDNKLQILFSDPEDEVNADTGELTIQGEESQSNRRIKIAESVVTFNNIELRNEGIHTLVLRVNDDSKEIAIPVIKKQDSGDNDE